MEILSYLAELVKTQKEVGIAGLGTFSKKKVPGRYDADNHAFLPPGYRLEFTRELKEDSLLIEFISKKKNLSYESAAYFSEQFSADLQKQLAEQREADLGELGKLSASADGIVFVPSGLVNYGFEFYGLPSLKEEANLSEKHYTEQQEDHVHERPDPEDHNADLAGGPAEEDEQPVYDEIAEIELVKEQSPPEPVYIETAEDLQEEPEEEVSAVLPAVTGTNENEVHQEEVKATDHYWNFDRAHALRPNDIADEPEPAEDSERKTPSYVYLIVTLLIIALAGIAMYFVKPELFGAGTAQRQVSPPAVKQSPVHIDSAAATGTDSLTKAAQADTNTTDSSNLTTQATAPAIRDTTTTWEIIGASVVKREVAQILADMKAKGINGKVIPAMPGKRIKISIATFYDEATALAERKKLAEKLKNPDLYVHRNRHTQTKIKK